MKYVTEPNYKTTFTTVDYKVCKGEVMQILREVFLYTFTVCTVLRLINKENVKC